MRFRGRMARVLAGAKTQPSSIPDAELVPINRDNPFERDENARNKRQEAALSMMDDDTYGYLLIVVKRDGDETGRLNLSVKLERPWWPAVRRMLLGVVDGLR